MLTERKALTLDDVVGHIRKRYVGRDYLFCTNAGLMAHIRIRYVRNRGYKLIVRYQKLSRCFISAHIFRIPMTKELETYYYINNIEYQNVNKNR